MKVIESNIKFENKICPVCNHREINIEFIIGELGGYVYIVGYDIKCMYCGQVFETRMIDDETQRPSNQNRYKKSR